ncbi:DNA-binding E3 ubiquitin-protein ligase [Saccharomycopsis crataegensis]|uniref:DNA-binding E3 ubiquitin-protein ligase n=1 Tax=Saccharomycopsis crataegensis TaxID=43959 RepID=A0AAV5QLY8_9ASCO|nr:DNA-binding E3 ubiquitin-protein ligase [Saccharomycopsis crataegensis]
MSTPRPKRRAVQKISSYNESINSVEDELPINAVADYQAAVQNSNTSSSMVSEPVITMEANANDVDLPSSGSSNISLLDSSKAATTKLQSATFFRSEIPNNWQPAPSSDGSQKFPVLMNISGANFLDDAKSVLQLADGTTTITKNDHIYMISEPAGEPYYIARVMGFAKKRNLKSNANLDAVDNYMIKVNWYYRPRDILRHSTDSRLLYATMHSDLCPVSSFRGKVTVKFKDEIDDLNSYRDKPSHFWYEKLFDRYMIKYYDILPTKNLINLPSNYQKALVKRFAYVFVEAGRGDDLLVTPKNCVKCNQWCSMTDSVECAKCKDYYHMLCLTPPLLKKPSRGYSWSCAKCSKQADDEMRKVRANNLSLKKKYDRSDASSLESISTTAISIDQYNKNNVTTSTSPPPLQPSFETLALEFLEHDSGLTLEERRAKEEWPYRYLGMHARLEDVLDVEDRPYPRASSRLGTKQQANVDEWYGHPEVYYDPDESEVVAKKRHYKTKRKQSKSVEDTPAAAGKKLEVPNEYKGTPTKELPPWVKPRPAGYIERGLDDGSSSTLMWKQPAKELKLENQIDTFVFKKCRPIAKELKMFHNSPNFLDAIFKTLLDTNFDFEKSYSIIKDFTRQSLKEPTFTSEEATRFDEGVRKYGSELLPVHRHVGTQSFGMIVRYYYLWKKTPMGHLIWDNFPGRKNKKIKKNANKSDSVDSIADPEDDSSYDNDASVRQRRHYQCKHCNITSSTKWFRASGHSVAPSDPKETVIALCFRCARLWRLYAVEWEDPFEVSKKLKGVGKRKVEHELAEDAMRILDEKEKTKVAFRISNGGNFKRKSSSPSPDDPIKKPRNIKSASSPSPSVSSQVTSSSVPGSAGKASTTKQTRVKKEPKVKREPKTKKEPATHAVTSTSQTKVQSTNQASGRGKRAKKEDSSGVTNLTLRFTAPQSQNSNKKSGQLVTNNDDNSNESDSDNDITPSAPVYHYIYNDHYTYNFENFDKKTHEFDNWLPEPKDDFTIPLSPKTKSSNSKDSPGIKHIISANGLFSPTKRPCCVCRSCDADDLNEILICSNCGLNVHASCYGVEVNPHIKMFTKEWCCDSCSNDLHPVCSTYYGCSLCYSKEIDHDSAIVGAPTAFPDALKRTINFKWAHIICSIFSAEIKFEDSKSLQGAVNMPLALLKNEFRFCDICNIKSGVLKKCMLCQNAVHLTCAQDSSNYFIGFRIIPELEFKDYSNILDDGKSKKLVKILSTGVVGVPEPVLICNDHPKDQNNGDLFKNVFPLREKAVWISNDAGKTTPQKAPIMKLYADGYMQWKGGIQGPALRYYEQALIKEEYRKGQVGETGNGSSKARWIGKDPATSSIFLDDRSKLGSLSDHPQSCSTTEVTSKYCGIISNDNWWESDDAAEGETETANSGCGFCEKTSSEKTPFKKLNYLKLEDNAYGIVDEN